MAADSDGTPPAPGSGDDTPDGSGLEDGARPTAGQVPLFQSGSGASANVSRGRAKGSRSRRPSAPGEPIASDPQVIGVDVAATIPEDLQEYFIPVWEHVRLWPSEVRLLDHPAMARLGDIYQLGQTHLVYRGATHRRLEHALGTLHTAQLMIEAIDRNYRSAHAKGDEIWSGDWRRSEPLRPEEVAFVRLAALLHDVGHLAAGHTFEDELGLLDKHDADARLNHVLDRDDWRGMHPELTSGNTAANSGATEIGANEHARRLTVLPIATFGDLIDSEYAGFAAATGLELTPREILLTLVSKDQHRAEFEAPPTSPFRVKVCRDLVGNTLCADLLDYLHRDWHHLGKPRHFDSRVLDYLEIREKRDHPASKAHLVVNVRQAHQVRLDAVTAIFDLLESRYQLGEVALFHRTKLCATAMLERLVAEINDAAPEDNWFGSVLNKLLDCSDDELLDLLFEEGNAVADRAPARQGDRLRPVLALAQRLRVRRLHKQIYCRYAYNLPGRVDHVRAMLGGKDGAANRLRNLRMLEDDFFLPRGSLAMYCPREALHTKVAGVEVLVHGEVYKLVDVEQRGIDPALTGGLLAAQQSRFERLWRVMFAISPEAEQTLESRETKLDMERAIRSLILGDTDGSATVSDEAGDIARKLVANRGYALYGRTVMTKEAVHARTRRADPETYASGAPTILSLIER
jgi:HD superfamily phosphohydrolase